MSVNVSIVTYLGQVLVNHAKTTECRQKIVFYFGNPVLMFIYLIIYIFYNSSNIPNMSIFNKKELYSWCCEDLLYKLCLDLNMSRYLHWLTLSEIVNCKMLQMLRWRLLICSSCAAITHSPSNTVWEVGKGWTQGDEGGVI